MFKGIRCECLLSLREVVIEWGIIGVCTDMPSKHLRERESTVDGSSVYRTTLVRQNQNMVARPFLPMFNKARHFNWLIT